MIGDLLNENSLMYTALTEMIYEQADINDSTHPALPPGFLCKAELSVFYQEGEECDLTKLSADAVLVTATAKVARFIDFDPLALSSVHYDSSTKIILTFSQRFWEDDDIKGGKSITDCPSRFIYYPSHSFPRTQTSACCWPPTHGPTTPCSSWAWRMRS
ncbi:hypothetical protein NHX12_014007 [Muraenolepis orangiensis]|uniref:Amine oxidase domain-containing protein n=1 Tax=Muraenolepis orangiensis TaxID=630683 RepID=A0A9Q0DCS9_9TELE|nr:hypothetical protein NHX12_014007 [Muraenolepis orangiensis]